MAQYLHGLTWQHTKGVCILRLNGYTVASTLIGRVTDCVSQGAKCIDLDELNCQKPDLILKLIVKLRGAFNADAQIRNNIQQMFGVEHLEQWIINWLFHCWLCCCAGQELHPTHDFTEKIIELYRKIETASDRLKQLSAMHV